MTTEAKIAIITGIFALLGSFGGVFIASFLKTNELKDQNRFNSQKVAIERIFINSYYVEEVCNSIESYDHTKEIDLKKFKEIRDTNTQTKMLIDIYFSDFSSKFNSVLKKEYLIYKTLLDNKSYKIASPEKKTTLAENENDEKILEKNDFSKLLTNFAVKVAQNTAILLEYSIFLGIKSSCENYNKESIKFRTELKNNFIGK
eukprot:gnl/Chilomastix_cuspidata/8395.p1 GENE.gnl/Chilomastix_cuspidata/8395~~gnl/Chilomastix_cuspidata/8395.p1  ORF type:complete len:202 (+),score=32.38 gnl/Chilomastix_cuspidata/8395:644-1249(+)